MNQVRKQPQQPRTIEEERVVAAQQEFTATVISEPTHMKGWVTVNPERTMHLVQFPGAVVIQVAHRNLAGALACGAVEVFDDRHPKMEETINGAPAGRRGIHWL